MNRASSLLQAKISSEVTAFNCGEISEGQCMAFIAGANTALRTVGLHFTYKKGSNDCSYGISEGALCITEFDSDSEYYSDFIQGYTVTQEILDYFSRISE